MPFIRRWHLVYLRVLNAGATCGRTLRHLLFSRDDRSHDLNGCGGGFGWTFSRKRRACRRRSAGPAGGLLVVDEVDGTVCWVRQHNGQSACAGRRNDSVERITDSARVQANDGIRRRILGNHGVGGDPTGTGY